MITEFAQPDDIQPVPHCRNAFRPRGPGSKAELDVGRQGSPQHCRFAATRPPEQRDYLARFDVDVDAAEHGMRSERPVDATK